MLLTLVIILILIGSAVVGSLYSNFLVFYKNFSETENYHKARYASIAATERAELVIKQREPGYMGSGGRIKSNDQPGSSSDNMPSGTTGFSYLSKNAPSESTLFRKIDSQTDRIPAEGKGNIDKLLAANDSPDYNTMDYENAEIFLLYYDAGDYDKPYKKKDCNNEGNCAKTILNGTNPGIKIALRLPPYIRTKFGDLDATDPLIQDGGYKDDAIVDWQIRGKYNTRDENPSAFTIFATQDAFGYGTGPNDSAIREKHLNQLSGLTFSLSDKRNPLTNQNTPPTIISTKETDISALDNAFLDVFEHSDNLQLRLSLLNLALGSGELAYRYPFLEYYIEFISSDPVIASDRYFTIETEGNYGDYKVDNIMYKPTITESILRSFTTIF